jgi:hypothetical protein
MTRECPPQEFEHAKTKNLPKFQHVPTNVFLVFWANFCHLATQKTLKKKLKKKKGYVEARKDFFGKNCSMSPHFEGKKFSNWHI